MGSPWNDENPYQKCGSKPKLILAGRLVGTVDGRPVSLIAKGHELTFSVSKVATLFALRRFWNYLSPLLGVLPEQSGIKLLVRLGWLGSLEAHPRPGLLLRMMLPRA